MPRLPPTPHSMEANEPCLGRWVHDDASGLEGLVIEVKTGGWRVVLSVDGNSVNRRSGALEYAAGEPPAELVNACQQDYNVPYVPATEAMRKKGLSRRRQEEIYKPRAKPPGAGAHCRPSLAPAVVALDVADQDTTGRRPSDVGRDPLVETFGSRARYGHHAAPTRAVERGRQ